MRHGAVALAAIVAVLLLFPAAALAQEMVISGTVVTPDTVLPKAWIAVKDGKIISVTDQPPVPMPALSIESGGIIFPGFVDLHNHPMYNIFNRWTPPKKFQNRYEWRDSSEYKNALGTLGGELQRRTDNDRTFCDIDEYAEVRALIGGTTSITGISPRRPTEFPQLVPNCVAGLVRNLDWASGFYGEGVGQERIESVLGITFRDMKESDAKRLRDALWNDRIDALLIHAGEGSPKDMESAMEFLALAGRGLANEHTAVIHGTALGADDFRKMKESGTSLIWSPRSNVALYGATTNIPAAFTEGVTIALAPDWSPTGSSNMLAELVYAGRFSHEQLSDFVSTWQLLEMATAIPARIARVDDKVGSLQPGRYADLFVLKGDGSQPFTALAQAKPPDVQLVLVGGVPLYGSKQLMTPFKVPLEQVPVCGTAMFLNSSKLPAGSFAGVQQRLKNDLKGNSLGLADLAECP